MDRVDAIAENLGVGGVPEDVVSLITTRVVTFLESFEADELVLAEMLQEEVEDLIEDAAVAINCLSALVPGWEVMARRLGVDYAILRGSVKAREVSGDGRTDQ